MNPTLAMCGQAHWLVARDTVKTRFSEPNFPGCSVSGTQINAGAVVAIDL